MSERLVLFEFYITGLSFVSHLKLGSSTVPNSSIIRTATFPLDLSRVVLSRSYLTSPITFLTSAVISQVPGHSRGRRLPVARLSLDTRQALSALENGLQ